MMGSSCAVEYTVPSSRRRFMKPRVELAPRQVQIGFDLSPKRDQTPVGKDAKEFDALPKPENSVIRYNGTAEERSKSANSCSISLSNPVSCLAGAATSYERITANTSPRSALQQLLLAPLTPSQNACSSPVPNPSITKQPVAAAPNLKWINCISACPSTSNEMTDSSNISSTTKPVVGSFTRSSGSEPPVMERQLPLTNKPENKSKESRKWMEELDEVPVCSQQRITNTSGLTMKEVMITVEHPFSPYCQRSCKVEIISSRKEAMSNEKSKKSSLFVVAVGSPPADTYNYSRLQNESHLYGTFNRNMDMDFLNACHLCRRHLSQGQDIFMYSGDKAFCSMECRYQQIAMDERKEGYAPSIIRSGASPVLQNSSTSTSTNAAATTTTHHPPIMINTPNFMNPAAVA